MTFKTNINEVLLLPFLKHSRKMNVYSKEFYSWIWEHLQSFIGVLDVFIEILDKILKVTEFQ